MLIAEARLFPYRLPLVRPWIAASATITMRQGMLLALTADDGTRGWGDCAPLPSSGAAGHGRVFAELETVAARLAGRAADALLADLPAIHGREVRWALEMALADLAARRRGVPLWQWLGGEGADSVPANAALGPLNAGCAVRAGEALAAGFSVAKLKVGLAAVDAEIAALRALVRATGGRLRLRLDANRAWTGNDAHRFLDAVSDLPIDGVEEPLAKPTVAALARLQAALPFAIAVDESLATLGAEALLAAGAVRRLVVKPARIGGLSATRDLAAKARAAGVEVVLTSVVDSAIGVTATAHLAAALAPGLAHGLGTLAWLARDVAPSPPLVGGRFVLGRGAGLGVVPFGEPPQG